MLRTLWLAAVCPMTFAKRLVKQERGRETIFDLEFGTLPVKLPGKTSLLHLWWSGASAGSP